MLVDTPAKYEHAVKVLCDQEDLVAWDLETFGKDWRGCPLVGIGAHVLRQGEHLSYYLPFRHKEGDNLPERLIKDFWTQVLHPCRPQATWHGSYDVKVAGHHDGYVLPAPGKFNDGILAALLLNENEESFKMEAVMQKYIDKNAGKQDEALTDYLHDRFGGSRREVKQHLWRAPGSVVGPYGEQDVKSTRQLLDFYTEHLPMYKLQDLYREMCEFQIDIARMEMRGVLINRPRLPTLYAQAEDNAARLKAEIQEAAGYPINPGSTKQLSSWLKVKSTAAAVLKRMPDDPRAAKILEWRRWSKAVSTYYKPYTGYMDDYGVMRCNLHITSPGILTRGSWASRNGTISGRLSSSKPNLQQIPKDSESYRVKELFIARPGYELFELDYSQAELRVAAHYSKDEKLTEILLSGGDMHDIVAEEMSVPRHIAKNMNFSAWYGIGYKTFAKNYHISLKDAREYLSGYHKMFRGVRRLYDACEAQADANGRIRLYTGRLRHYNCLQSPTYKSSNNLIQGSVGEMVRRAITRTAREVPEAPQVLMVHDSIWFEVPTQNKMATVKKLRGIMQDQPQFSLPMLVDAKGGKGFATAVDYPRDPVGVPKEALDRITDWDAVFGQAA